MGRRRIQLEAYDVVTGWPLRVYDGYVAAEAGGFKRAAIDACLKGRRNQHHGVGWRAADVTSRLGRFIAEYFRPEPAAYVPYADVYGAYMAYCGLPAPTPGDIETAPTGLEHSPAVKQRLLQRHKIDIIDTGRLHYLPGGPRPILVEAVMGLAWRS